jgi:subtilisin family serine protease
LWDKAIDALSSVGVMVVASAGNAGPSCKTVTGPPGTIPQVFTVAALGVKTHNIASFSSRGTVKEFPEREKPDISASGSSVVSSVPGGRYGTKSGTSMSCPAVNGAVALLWSSRPKLQRDILNTRKLFETTAYHQKTKTCSDKELPNNVYGWGTINIGKAYEESMRLNRD